MTSVVVGRKDRLLPFVENGRQWYRSANGTLLPAVTIPELGRKPIRKLLPYSRTAGAYALLDLVTGKVYVGSTNSLLSRKKSHELSKGHNRLLRRIWSERGKSDFLFLILEECPSDKCLDTERKWVKACQATDHNYGYNVSRVVTLPKRVEFNRLTLKQRALLRVLADGKKHPRRELWEALGDALLEANNLGVHLSGIKKALIDVGEDVHVTVQMIDGSRRTFYQWIKIIPIEPRFFPSDTSK